MENGLILVKKGAKFGHFFGKIEKTHFICQAVTFGQKLNRDEEMQFKMLIFQFRTFTSDCAVTPTAKIKVTGRLGAEAMISMCESWITDPVSII